METGLSVQYGCGFDAPSGWVNFDNSPGLRFERLTLIGKLYTKNVRRFPENVQYGNIVTGLPLGPNSADRLYASHVLEHLPKEDAIKALKNSFRILRPGAVFRLIVPDLYSRAIRYVAASGGGDPTAADQFMISSGLGMQRRPISIMDKLSLVFGGSRHLWMWDESAIKKVLKDVGFVEIRRCSFGDSGDPYFTAVEREERFIDGSIIELAMECRKPLTA